LSDDLTFPDDLTAVPMASMQQDQGPPTSLVSQMTFTDPREMEEVNSETNYIPEIDYKARDYKPIGTRIDAEVEGEDDQVFGPEEHFCTRCKNYYAHLINVGNVDASEFKNGWPIHCFGDRAELMKQYTDEVLDRLVDEGVLPDTEHDRQYFRISWDPVSWAALELDVEADWYQAEMLRCSSQWKAVRAGRRVGKTYAMCIDIWWRAYTKEGSGKDKYEILILCPYEAQVKKIFDDLLSLMNRSPALKASYKRSAKSPWEIELHNGTIIRGFSAGRKTGAKSDKVRGQGADAIYFDEIDYMDDSDIETVLATMASQKNTTVWMSSTPTGARTKLYTMCRNKNLRYKEFHFISAESPRWSPDVERMLKEIYSDGGFSREFLAEFGTPTEGVFNQKYLDRCIRDFDYKAVRRNPAWNYVIGVDWNKHTGTHIIVLERGFRTVTMEDGSTYQDPFYRVVDKKVIRKAEFQQTQGVHAVLQMAKLWAADYIYVDQGFGEMQLEQLWLLDRQMNLNLDLHKKLVAVHGNEPIYIRDPRPGMQGEFIKKPAKPFMVDLLSQWVSANKIFFAKKEDTTAPLIESEIPFLDIGLVQQMREFRVEGYSPEGRARYSQGYEHTLMALGFAAIGMATHFTSIGETTRTTTIHTSNVPIGMPKPQQEGLVPGVEESMKPYLTKQELPSQQASLFQQTVPNRTLEAQGKIVQNTFVGDLSQVRDIVEGRTVQNQGGKMRRIGLPTRALGMVQRTIPR